MSVPADLSLRTPSQVQDDLYYLQEHRICETLEFIVKGILREQPEDPILSICNMLRASNRSNSSVRFSLSPALQGPLLQTRECANAAGSAGCSPLAQESTSRPFPIGGCGVDIGPATRAGISGSSRADTPASGAPPGRWDAQSNGTRLERDESSRSDGSAFSISSIDMSEFLSEFRAAHLALFGEAGGASISLQDLADLVDKISIPLPDVKLLVDLFNELEEPAGVEGGSVHFDAFLARMNFKIQGRYPQEVIRNVFYSLLPTDSRPSLQGKTLPGNASVGSNLDAFLMGGSCDHGRDALVDGSLNHASQSLPSATVSADYLSAVLWRCLGLRHEGPALETALLPFKRGASYTLFFNDFSKVVHTFSSPLNLR